MLNYYYPSNDHAREALGTSEVALLCAQCAANLTCDWAGSESYEDESDFCWHCETERWELEGKPEPGSLAWLKFYNYD